MKLVFLVEARAEFREAADFYEGKERGLGLSFAVEVRDVCRAILEHPMIWRERQGGFRRVNCPVFPYSIA